MTTLHDLPLMENNHIKPDFTTIKKCVYLNMKPQQDVNLQSSQIMALKLGFVTLSSFFAVVEVV